MTDKPFMDYLGFATSAKRAVKLALESARFNPENRAGHVAAKAVLELIDAGGVQLTKLYDSIGIPPRRVKYSAPFPTVCTVRSEVGVYDGDFKLIYQFWIEKSWIKDEREKCMNEQQRGVYIENIVNAEAHLTAIIKHRSMKSNNDPAVWPDNFQIGILQTKELFENSRKIP